MRASALVYTGPSEPEKGIGSLELELRVAGSSLMWVLGTQPRPSTRAARVLTAADASTLHSELWYLIAWLLRLRFLLHGSLAISHAFISVLKLELACHFP